MYLYKLFYSFFICMLYHDACVKLRGQLRVVESLIPSCVFWGLNLSLQVQQQAHLPSERSHQPKYKILNQKNLLKNIVLDTVMTLRHNIKDIFHIQLKRLDRIHYIKISYHMKDSTKRMRRDVTARGKDICERFGRWKTFR